MIGLFAPAVFIAMMSFVFGSDKIIRPFINAMFGLGIVLAIVFAIANIFAIGGSQEIFSIGSYKAYDGLWFRES